ncbi:MAG: hypothetical protein ABII89_07520 [Candidatus Omnitrophota bacterium]
MFPSRRIYLLVFFCSFASLAYEVTLTRIFSISLWYHFAFMIVSIAMLGIGASGTVLSLYPKLKNLSRLGIYSLLLGISIPFSYLLFNQMPFEPVKLSWSRIQLLYFCLYYLVFSLPFFFSGLIVATALSCRSERSGLLYGADLLGAGIGSMGVLALMADSGPETVVFVLSSLVLVATFFFSRKFRAVPLVLILFNLSFLLLRPGFGNLKISPFKELPSALKYPGANHLNTYYSPFSRIDTFQSPAVRFAPGLSLKYTEMLPEQIGFSIDADEMNAVTFSADGAPGFLKYLPSALPYAIAERREVLTLDPKGGLPVLLARHHGAREISKVESNPLLVKIVRREFSEFSAGIYSRNTWTGLGRSWLKKSGRHFDLIDISLMGSAAVGSAGLSEDYRFTVEAFTQYLEHLSPEGILSISLYLLPPPRTELKLLATIAAAMEEMKIKDLPDRLAAIRSWGTLSLVLKKTPFTPEEINNIRRFCDERWFDPVYYPGIREEETGIYIRTATDEYYAAFQKLVNPDTWRSFVDDYLFDIRPVRDNRPFFRYYLRTGKIRETYRVMDRKWTYFIEEGFILPPMLVQAAFLSLVLILLPAAVGRKERKKSPAASSRRGCALAYFALLGTGYMFVVISLIQKMVLPLESPSYATAAVLASILVSSGLGSLLSNRISRLKNPATTLAVSSVVFIYSLTLPRLTDAISPHPLAVKFLVVFLLLAPAGLFMGTPFPTGIRILGERDKTLIPWAWATNGCFSVLAPIAAVMLAIAAGFQTVLWTGAAVYTLSFAAMKRFLAP